MRFVNLTPHPLDIYRLDGKEILCTIKPEPVALRLNESDEGVVHSWIHPWAKPGGEDGAPNNIEVKFWEPDGNYCMFVPTVLRRYDAPALPPPRDGTVLIVSLPALMGLRAAGETRDDLVAPDTGPGSWGAVRDEKGNVIGVRRLVSIGNVRSDGSGEVRPAAEWEAANPAVW